jgi:hypothetical protein
MKYFVQVAIGAPASPIGALMIAHADEDLFNLPWCARGRRAAGGGATWMQLLSWRGPTGICGVEEGGAEQGVEFKAWRPSDVRGTLQVTIVCCSKDAAKRQLQLMPQNLGAAGPGSTQTPTAP